MAAGAKVKREIFRGEDLAAQEREIVDRLLATAAGLPRICALKRCRRRKRCFGQTTECLRLHTGHSRGIHSSRRCKSSGGAERGAGPAARRGPRLALCVRGPHGGKAGVRRAAVVDRGGGAGHKGPLAERGAAWLAHQSGGLGVGSSNLAAPTNSASVQPHEIARQWWCGYSDLLGRGLSAFVRPGSP